MLELLVSIAIIGVVVALIAPAVQRAREAARRVECASHLRQIGHGLHEYESVHGKFPNNMSVTRDLLPHAGHPALYAKYLERPSLRQAELVLHPVNIPLYRCPSDPAPHPATNYCTNIGSGWQKYGYNGFFVPARQLAVRDIRDGLSQTAALSEIIVSDGSDDRLKNIWDVVFRYRDPDELDLMADYCDQLPPRPAEYSYNALGGRGWRWCSYSPDSSYNHVLGPNRPSCQHGGIHTGSLAAGSFHPGGANTLYGDGHVDFTSNAIDRYAWREIGSRAPGLKEDFP